MLSLDNILQDSATDSLMCILQFKDLKWQKLKNYIEICKIESLNVTKKDKVTEKLAKKNESCTKCSWKYHQKV